MVSNSAFSASMSLPYARSPKGIPKPAKRANKTSAFMQFFRKQVDLKADILMSIMPEHMANIASGAKNHEYRKYLLPRSVRRIWFYTSHPKSRIEFVAQISPGRKPGQVPEDGGLGNEDFNAGRKISEFGYATEQLWKLPKPISLRVARDRAYLKATPQKYIYAPPNLVTDYPLSEVAIIINGTKRHLPDVSA